MTVEYKDYTDNIKQRMKARKIAAQRRILDDIYKESLPNTPKKKGWLRRLDGSEKPDAGREVDKTTGRATITWSLPYASYQERGMRYDGSHKVKHYTTPGTGPWFAKNAVEKVITPYNLRKYYTFKKL